MAQSRGAFHFYFSSNWPYPKYRRRFATSPPCLKISFRVVLTLTSFFHTNILGCSPFSLDWETLSVQVSMARYRWCRHYAGDGYDCDNDDVGDGVGGYGGVGDRDVGNGAIGVNNAPPRPGVHQLNFTLIAGVGEGAAVFGRLQVFSPSFSS